MVWPTATAPSANNWTDHFSGSSLDPRWGVLASGSSAPVVTDSYLDLAPASVGVACAVYWTTKLDLTRRFVLSVCFSPLNSNGPSFIVGIQSGAWTPAVGALSTVQPFQRTQYGFQNGAGTAMAHAPSYYSTSHTETWWDGSANAWSTTNTVNGSAVGGNLQTNDYYIAKFICDGPNNRFRWDGYGLAFGSAGTYTANQGLRQFVSTDWLNFSSLEDTSQGLWLLLGVPNTGNGRSNDFRYEWVRYAEAPGNVWYEAYAARKSSSSAGHDTAHYLSADALDFFLEGRTTNALSRGATYDSAECQEPFFVWDGAAGGTDHLWYKSVNGSGVQTISHATATHATPQSGPWTKDAANPILSPSATGTAQDDQNVGGPFVVYDQTTGDWWMVYNGQSSVDSKWRTFLATATSAAGPWTKQGRILDVGASGALDEKWARSQCLVRYGGLWYLCYEAKNASSIDRTSYATASTIAGPWTKSGVDWWDAQPNGDTTLTATLNTAPGRTWAVADATGFAQDAVIVAANSTNLDQFIIDKARKTSAGTIETYHGATGMGTSPQAYVIATASSPTWNVRQLWQFGGVWNAYHIVWEPFSATPESASVGALYEGAHVATHTAASPVGAVPVPQDFSNPVIPHDAWSGMESVENMTLALSPFTGDPNTPVTLTLTQATLPALGKAAAKPLALAQAQAVSLLRGAGKAFAPTQSTAPAIGRAVGKPLAASQPHQPTLTKQTAKSLRANQATAPMLTNLKSKLLNLSVVQATAAGVGKGVALSRALGQATQPALTKAVSLPLSAAQATLAALTAVKQAGGTTINLTVIQPTQAGLTKAAALVRAAPQPTVPKLTKATAKSLAAVQATAALLQALRTHLVTLSAVQPTVAVLTKQASTRLAATQGTAATLGKQIGKGIATVQATVASLVTSGGQPTAGSVATLSARVQAWVLKAVATVFGQPSYALSPGPITQSHYETKTRTADFTAALPPGATSISSPVGYLVRAGVGADVTAASLTVGSPSGATVPFTLTALTPGVQYTLNIVVQASGNTITGEATVVCPD